MLYITRGFYQVEAEKKIFFEMRHLYEFKYWGDKHMREWKAHWDDVVRNQRVPPDEKVLEEIFIPLCRQSARLSIPIGKYELAFEDDDERSYTWMDKMVEKTIREDQSRANLESLAAGAEAASHPKKQPAAPGATGTTPVGDPAKTTDPADPKPKGGKGGKGDKGGKKGKGKDGGKTPTGASPGGGNSPKPFDPNRSCILNLFGKCKHGAVLGKGVKCERGTHRKKPLDAEKTHPFFLKMEKEHGTWEPNKFKYPDGTVAVPGVNKTGGAQAPAKGPSPSGSPTNGGGGAVVGSS